MKKALIVLTGDNYAKQILRDKLTVDFWVWGVSALNHLRHVAVELGCDDTYSSSGIERLMRLSNELWDYEYFHIGKYVKKVFESNKAENNGKIADVLLVDAHKELIDRLVSDFDFVVLHVTMGKTVKDNFKNGVFYIGMGDTEEKVEQSISEVMRLIVK